MRKLLNTLFVSTQGAYLNKDGETVALSVERETKGRIPLLNLEGIVCFGNVLCSPFLLGACAEGGVSVSFLTENGKFLAKVQGPVSGNILLRKEQFRWADSPERRGAVAKFIVAGKIANCRGILLRAARDHGDNDGGLDKAGARLLALLRSLAKEDDVDSIRGIEGEAAASYFAAFDCLVTTQRDFFKFTGRTRRPPLDPINALLSFAYTLLCHDVVAALESAGLDPAAGFLHTDRPGRPSLALDLMEELRPCFADRAVLSCINLRKLGPKSFKTLATGATLLTDDARKEFLTAWQERKREMLTHPFLGEKIQFGLLPYVQAMLLARFIRGGLDAYPPYILK